MEYWDIYDRHGNPIGSSKAKNEPLASGEFHLGVSLWIVNQYKEILIQKRAPTKRIRPNTWAVTGGSVLSGETSRQGCVREAKEEIGLQVDEDKISLLYRCMGTDTIYDNYIIFQDFSTDVAVLQPDEVSEIKWASVEEICQMFRSGLFMLDAIHELEVVTRHIDKAFI